MLIGGTASCPRGALAVIILLALLDSVAILVQAILEQALLAHDYVDASE